MAAVELTKVASSKVMLNGVAVSPKGRVFSSFPRWTDNPTPSLAEAMPDGSFKPFPGDDWNTWLPGKPAHDSIVNAHAVFADSKNNLWVIDDATPHYSAMVEGAPKLIKFDLNTNRVGRVYPMDQQANPTGAVMGHMRVDEHYAYVTESRLGALLVVNLETGKARRVLTTDKSTRADPAVQPVVQGVPFRHRDGKVPLIHVALLELSLDAKWLYFTPLFGPVLRRVETRYLQDESLSEAQLAARVEDVVKVPPLAGLTRDAAGNFYFCCITEDAILKMGPDGKLQTLISDPRISFPNEPSVGPDGYLYFPSSQAHLAFLPGTPVIPPYDVFKIRIA